LQQVSL